MNNKLDQVMVTALMPVLPDIWICANVYAPHSAVTLIVLEKQLIEVATLIRQSIQLGKIL